MGLFQKVTTCKLCQNANFENGGTTIQIGILHVLLNILSMSLLSRVHDTFCYFKMQKDLSQHFTFKENKQNAGGRLELLASIFS